jgi:solute carrier family 35, member C2
MSIAGIAKEVSTITLSAWFFGDKLTPLNMTGVAITFCGMDLERSRDARRTDCFSLGIGLFTYHKYSKSMESSVPLDAHGNPISEAEEDGDAEERAHLTG